MNNLLQSSTPFSEVAFQNLSPISRLDRTIEIVQSHHEELLKMVSPESPAGPVIDESELVNLTEMAEASECPVAGLVDRLRKHGAKTFKLGKIWYARKPQYLAALKNMER